MSINEIPKTNNVRVTKLHLNKTEHKILSMALNNDDRVQNYYSKEVFNCMFLSDYVSKLRTKLSNYFKNDRFEIIQTETHQVIKVDGSKAEIGIFRINPNYKLGVRKLLTPNLNNEMQGSN